jgi:DNA (cytosine-5)-methyltransferase 1
MTITQAGLCEGYGGISMAVADTLGAELAWYCEHEPPTANNPNPANAAARLLAHHHPNIPNHGDLTVVDWTRVQRVDVLTGGWPCQPFSTAGRQRGAADERAIWPQVARAVRHLRPGVVVLENVPNIVAMGELARAVGDLAGLGYVGSWRCVRASDVGAPHRRRRIFIVAAHPDSFGRPGAGAARHGWDGSAHRRRVVVADAAGPRRGPLVPVDVRADGGAANGHGETENPADPDSGPVRQQPITLPGSDGPAGPGRDHTASPDPDGNGFPVVGERPELDAWDDADRRAPDGDVDWGVYAPAIHRWGRVLGRPAPAPTVLGARGGRQLSPLFVEWMQGLPFGHVTGVPGLTRNNMLTILGNGVVPQQCAHALRLALPSVLATAGQVAA